MVGVIKPATSMDTLFNKPVLSDIKIKQIQNGQTREYYAHKATLCGQSKYFMKAFTGNFKEATTNEMELHDDDPEHFQFVLNFMYTGEYDQDTVNSIAGNDETKHALTALGIYALADKYDITRLYEPTSEDLASKLESYNGSDYSFLKQVIETYYGECACTKTPMGKQIAAAVLDIHRKFTKEPAFTDCIESFPVFAADIALHYNEQGMFNVKMKGCPSCKKMCIPYCTDGMYRHFTLSYPCTHCAKSSR